MNNEMKRNFEFAGLTKDTDGKLIGYLDGWTFSNKNYNGAAYKTNGISPNGMITNNEMTYITVGTYLHISKVKYFFGEDFANTLTVDEQNGVSLYINITCWDHVSKRLKAFNPGPNQKMGFFGQLKVESFNRNDGSIGHKIVMTAYDFKSVYKKKEM